MTGFATLLQQGNSWLFLPSAILLGALHGLEPGHSKTMMAAFIIAVRGTLAQAVLLGLAATLSHTAIVWAVGLGGLYFGRQWNTATSELYFQIASALAIIAVAVWMMIRTWHAGRTLHAEDHDHGHAHDGDHVHQPHGDLRVSRPIHTGHGTLTLSLEGAGAAAHFVIHAVRGALPEAAELKVIAARADGAGQVFALRREGERLVSVKAVPPPPEFVARLHLGHEGHSHDFDVEFVSGTHRHAVSDYEGLDVSAPGYQDPHELAHANDIRRRFANHHVTTGQIVLFGLTAGLLPCPAAITVLLLCLQLKKFVLGATLVLGFSVGLALTMVTSGVVAALGVRHLSRRFGSSFATFTRRAPYFSGALILLVGLFLGYQGVRAL